MVPEELMPENFAINLNQSASESTDANTCVPQTQLSQEINVDECVLLSLFAEDEDLAEIITTLNAQPNPEALKMMVTSKVIDDLSVIEHFDKKYQEFIKNTDYRYRNQNPNIMLIAELLGYASQGQYPRDVLSSQVQVAH